MAVGCVVTISPTGEVLKRVPYWPWPAPGAYPIQQADGTYLQFFPVGYWHFPIGAVVQPFPPCAYPSIMRKTVKTLAKNVPLDLGPRKYVVDILLGIYTSSKRPAIILVDSPSSPSAILVDSSPVAVATAPAPAEYLQHLSPYFFSAKTWSENEGLWEVLSLLVDEDENPLFIPTRHKVTLGFAISPIYALGALGVSLYNDLITEMEHDHE